MVGELVIVLRVHFISPNLIDVLSSFEKCVYFVHVTNVVEPRTREIGHRVCTLVGTCHDKPYRLLDLVRCQTGIAPPVMYAEGASTLGACIFGYLVFKKFVDALVSNEFQILNQANLVFFLVIPVHFLEIITWIIFTFETEIYSHLRKQIAVLLQKGTILVFRPTSITCVDSRFSRHSVAEI